MTHTVNSLFHRLKNNLCSNYEENEAANLTKMILEYLYAERWQSLFQQGDMPISPKNLAQAEFFLQKLLQHQPIQYVLGESYFYERRFWVNEDVLIPRGETEELMLWLVEEVKKKNKACKVLDVGTGSGCIPISAYLELAEKGIEATIVGTDISENALYVARKNAEILKANVTFFPIDILNTDAKTLGKWDIIVSNPPYIPFKDIDEMAKHVKDFEPHLALFVPNEDPLIFYKSIATIGKEALFEDGLLLFEIYSEYSKELQGLFEQIGYKNIACRKDIHGKERMIQAQK